MGDEWRTLPYLCLVGQSPEKWSSLGSLHEVLSKIILHYFPLYLRRGFLAPNPSPRMSFFIIDYNDIDTKPSWS